ncbi:MAG: carboxypeptidase-like regulatory domain-containing protein [Crocinitomicaceae bacterium]
MWKYLLAITFILASIEGKSQNNNFTISGQIKNSSNGEDVPFATVTVAELPGKGTKSNIYGFYSLSLPSGQYTIQYRFVGFETIEKKVQLNKNTDFNIEFKESSNTLETVEVSSEKIDANLTDIGGITKINPEEIKKLALFGGEPDIMAVLELNPGFKSAGEGNAGFYVRGGGLDQNLVLLDEAPVYNPSHLLGFFSVFNGDALRDAVVYKGGMPAEYGGRTSSVLDIRMKDGNSKNFGVSGGLGLIASRLTVEGPIVKDKGSFMVSGRRTYLDLFTGLANDEALSNTQLFFYDLNLKANYRLGERDKVMISGYFGRDKLGFNEAFSLNWGNTAGNLRWNHVFKNKKLFSNTSFIYSNYDYEFGFGIDENKIAVQSVIRDINLKQDFTYYLNSNNSFKFGANFIHHTIEPGNLTAGENTGINSLDAESDFGLEGALYVQNSQKIGNRLSIDYGLRYSMFAQLGEGTVFEFDNNGESTSSSFYNAGEVIQYYGGLEPRFSSALKLDENSSWKLGYNRNFQYIHVLSNATSSNPTDRWIMSSNNVKPQIADQISTGYFRNFKDNMFSFSSEIYYKWMHNAIDYRTGANAFFNDQIEGDLLTGKGEAYGLELQFKKNKGKLTGWVSYTLSRTLRQFDELNNGEKFSAKQDRIHDLSVVGVYAPNDRWSFTGNFVFYTGDAVTFPEGQYIFEGAAVPLYTERNGYRMPNYHRLDLGVTLYSKKFKESKDVDTGDKILVKRKLESSWNFSVYNTYGRENAFSINFQPNEDNPTINEAVQLSLFRWIPSITYNFKF